MKRKTWKRVFGMLLCLLLLIAALPVWALSTEAAGVEYYGRKQLESMPNATALLYAYDQIVAGVEKAETSITVYNGKNSLSVTELQTVMDVYRRDYAHHFWLDNGYSYVTSGGNCLRIKPKYLMTGSALEQAKKDFNAAVNKILAGITDSMSELERELYLHDTLAGMITYKSGTYAHSAYGALVEGSCVCEGYTEALQYLLQRAGICSFIALGRSINPQTSAQEGHSWNYVRIDGKFYHVDLTWDDQDTRLFHAYFNQTDDVFSKDHVVDETAYPLPVCNSTKAMYFTGKETMLTSYDVERIGRILKENDLAASFYIVGSKQEFISWYQENARAIAREAGISGSYRYAQSNLGQEVQLTLSVPNCSHNNMAQQSGVNATCTAPGYKAYYRCACGKYFEDKNAAVEIPDLAAWKKGAGKIEKTEHNYADGWDYDSNGHWHSCICGETTKTTDHKDGDQNGFCDACGYQTGTPPKNPDPTEGTEPEGTDPTEGTEPEGTDPTEGTEPEGTDPTEGTEPEETDPTEGTEPEETDPTEGTEPKETDPTEGTEPKETEPTQGTAPGTTNPTENTDSNPTEPTQSTTPDATDPTDGDAPPEKDHTATVIGIAAATAAIAAAAVILIRKKR